MTQLCITLPAFDAPQGGELLAAALAVATVAAVVIVAGDDGAIAPASALPLIAQGQKAGAAVLVYGDAHLARTLRADGVHLPWGPDVVARMVEAREILGQGGIVGVEAGTSRHDAMELGEKGADYVAFAPAAGADDAAAVEARFDLVAWWADLFEIPVVAMLVNDAGEAAALAAVDADFIAVPIAAAGGAALLEACAKAIADASAVPAE